MAGAWGMGHGAVWDDRGHPLADAHAVNLVLAVMLLLHFSQQIQLTCIKITLSARLPLVVAALQRSHVHVVRHSTAGRSIHPYIPGRLDYT